MGKFGIISKDEDRAIELIFGESLGQVEAQRVLASEGIEMSKDKLKHLKRSQFNVLAEEMRDEAKSEFLLKSINKVILQFEDLYVTYDKLAKKLEAQGEDFQQIIVLREQRGMLNTSLKVLGQLQSGIARIQAQNVNIISNSDVMLALEQDQSRLFSMGAEIKDGALVINNPTPELIDSYQKWKFRSGKANANTFLNP